MVKLNNNEKLTFLEESNIFVRENFNFKIQLCVCF